MVEEKQEIFWLEVPRQSRFSWLKSRPTIVGIRERKSEEDQEGSSTMKTMRKLPRILPPVIEFRSFTTSYRLLQSPPSPEPPKPQLKPENYLTPDQLTHRLHKNLTNHPQAPLPTKGFGPFTRDRETGKRLTLLERTEERAKEYLYSEPDPNQPLPPLLLRPPGLTEPPKEGDGHGKETRSWWRRELEIWFGRYQNPFDVKAQLARHRRENSYQTEWSPKADRRSVRRTHGKVSLKEGWS